MTFERWRVALVARLATFVCVGFFAVLSESGTTSVARLSPIGLFGVVEAVFTQVLTGCGAGVLRESSRGIKAVFPRMAETQVREYIWLGTDCGFQISHFT